MCQQGDHEEECGFFHLFHMLYKEMLLK